MTLPKVLSVAELMGEFERMPSSPCCAVCQHIDFSNGSASPGHRPCIITLQTRAPDEGADCPYYEEARPPSDIASTRRA